MPKYEIPQKRKVPQPRKFVPFVKYDQPKSNVTNINDTHGLNQMKKSRKKQERDLRKQEKMKVEQMQVEYQ